MTVLLQIYVMVLLFGGVIGAILSLLITGMQMYDYGWDSDSVRTCFANTGVGVIILLAWPLLVVLALPALLVYSVTVAFKVYIKKEEPA